MTNETQWTAEDIQEAVEKVAHRDIPDMHPQSVTVFQAEQLMRRIRNDLQARIDTLTAERNELSVTLQAYDDVLAAERYASRIADADMTGDLAMAADEIRRLCGELEAAKAGQEWEPVGVAIYSTDDATFAVADEEISIITDEGDGTRVVGWTLPDHIRLCHRVAPAAGDGAGKATNGA